MAYWIDPTKDPEGWWQAILKGPFASSPNCLNAAEREFLARLAAETPKRRDEKDKRVLLAGGGK